MAWAGTAAGGMLLVGTQSRRLGKRKTSDDGGGLSVWDGRVNWHNSMEYGRVRPGRQAFGARLGVSTSRRCPAARWCECLAVHVSSVLCSTTTTRH